MKNDNSHPLDRSEIRRQAEERLKKRDVTPDFLGSKEELLRMVQELSIHQIELEIQAEELKDSRDEIEREHNRYIDLYDFSPVGYLTLARDGTIRQANLAVARILSLERSRLLGARFGSFIAQRDLTVFNSMVDRVFQSRTQEHCEIMIENNGTTNTPTKLQRTLRLDAIITDNQQECRLSLTDISDIRQALDALKKKEEQYRCLFEAAQEGIMILDYKSGEIVDANPYIAHLMGFSLDEIIGKELWEIGFILDKELAQKAYLELQTKRYIRYSDLPLQHKSGKVIDVEFISYVYNVGEEKAIQCTIRDITQQKQLREYEKRQNDIIKQFALHDSLTGLPNRRLLSERLLLTLAQCSRNKAMAALLIFDLDKFKIVNDSLGHAVGDTLLQEVAARSVATLHRSTDSISRLGGDEFVILLPQIVAVSDAVTIAEKIRINIKEPYNIDGHTINISCSIGIAVYPDHGETELTLMKHADEAMYRAKNQGRDNVTVFETEANLEQLQAAKREGKTSVL